MADKTLVKIARVIATTIHREEAEILRKKREDRAEAQAIYAAYEANPTLETLQGLISLNERAHKHAKIAHIQIRNLAKMASDLERIIEKIRQRQQAARAKGDEKLAVAFNTERGHYERSLAGVQEQQKVSHEMMEQMNIAVERSDAILEREKARVAALYPPKENNGEGE